MADLFAHARSAAASASASAASSYALGLTSRYPCSAANEQPEPKSEILTNIKTIRGSFEWVIEDWASMPSAVNSAEVECAGHRWRLRVYPSGREEEFAGHVSLYLYYCGREQGVSTSYTLRIVNQLAGKPDFVVSVSRKKNFGFHHTGEVVNNRGFPTFISQARLNDESRGLKVADRVVIRAELRVMADEPSHQVRTNPSASSSRWAPPESLARDLLTGLQNGEGATVTLLVEDQRILSHREILSMRSPVFRAMFVHGTVESNRHEIRIQDMSVAVVRELLHFMYTDSCSEGALEVIGEQLLAAADKYQVERLRQLCEVELASSLAVHNASERLALAELHAAEQLREECVDFIAQHAEEVLATPEWVRLASNPASLSVVNDVLTTIVGIRRKRPIEVVEDEVPELGTGRLTPTGLKRLRMSDLRRELSSRGLDAGGSKATLQARLLQFVTARSPAEGHATGSDDVRGPAVEVN